MTLSKINNNNLYNNVGGGETTRKDIEKKEEVIVENKDVVEKKGEEKKEVVVENKGKQEKEVVEEKKEEVVVVENKDKQVMENKEVQNKFLKEVKEEQDELFTMELNGRVPKPDFYFGLTALFRKIPYYKRATANLDGFKISIVTQTTVDRLYKVAKMAERWRGPISTAVYITNPEVDIDKMKNMIDVNPILKEFADIHLFYANHTRYPVNNLRNFAIQSARTDYVFIMDADFVTPTGLHDYLVSWIEHPNYNTDPEIKHAFVVPSFSTWSDPDTIPNDKEGLLKKMVEDQTIKPSNLEVCMKCHTPTNYPRWMIATEPYYVDYHWVYEPYLVYNRSRNELFDERLKGYGFDKNSHVWVMAAQKYRFTVLPRAYIVHINHDYTSWFGPSFEEQLWDSLRVVCDIFPTIKKKYGYDPNARLFDEPATRDACLSTAHW
eukprot:gene5757-7164_t